MNWRQPICMILCLGHVHSRFWMPWRLLFPVFSNNRNSFRKNSFFRVSSLSDSECWVSKSRFWILDLDKFDCRMDVNKLRHCLRLRQKCLFSISTEMPSSTSTGMSFNLDMNSRRLRQEFLSILTAVPRSSSTGVPSISIEVPFDFDRKTFISTEVPFDFDRKAFHLDFDWNSFPLWHKCFSTSTGMLPTSTSTERAPNPTRTWFWALF